MSSFSLTSSPSSMFWSLAIANILYSSLMAVQHFTLKKVTCAVAGKGHGNFVPLFLKAGSARMQFRAFGADTNILLQQHPTKASQPGNKLNILLLFISMFSCQIPIANPWSNQLDQPLFSPPICGPKKEIELDWEPSQRTEACRELAQSLEETQSLGVSCLWGTGLINSDPNGRSEAKWPKTEIREKNINNWSRVRQNSATRPDSGETVTYTPTLM